MVARTQTYKNFINGYMGANLGLLFAKPFSEMTDAELQKVKEVRWAAHAAYYDRADNLTASSDLAQMDAFLDGYVPVQGVDIKGVDIKGVDIKLVQDDEIEGVAEEVVVLDGLPAW